MHETFDLFLWLKISQISGLNSGVFPIMGSKDWRGVTFLFHDIYIFEVKYSSKKRGPYNLTKAIFVLRENTFTSTLSLSVSKRSVHSALIS